MTHDEQVRRLLADTQHTEPMPADLVDRMDGVIADLGAERPVSSTVADLAAARRRRRAAALLVAAAAVIVVGVGAAQLRGDVASPDAASSGSAPADRSPAPAAGDSAQDRLESDSSADEEESSGSMSVAPQEHGGRAARVAPEDFTAAALQLRSRAFELRRYSLSDGSTAMTKDIRCPRTGWGAGRGVRIRYDGAPAVIVYRPPSGDTQVVDLFLCGSDEPSRSVTLPVP